jgi:D-sedoheptulose 7-phosphate isomerase
MTAETPQSYFRRSCEALQRAAEDNALQSAIASAADRVLQSLRQGGKVMLAGNGGSAADAQHIATEIVVRFRIDRAPLAAIALTTDTSALTAAGNDYGFEHIFERQLRGLGRRGDIFIGISTSGRSPNVIAVLKAARELGIVTVGFTGQSGGDMRSLCDVLVAAPSDETALIQQIHITALHAVCAIVEDAFADAK